MKVGPAVLACLLAAACSGLPSETEIVGRLPDGRGYVVSFETGMANQEPDGVNAFIVVDLDQVDVTPDDLGCGEACTPVLGVTSFERGSGPQSTFEDGIFRSTSGNWTMRIAVYQNILDAWDGDTGALLDSIDPLDTGGELPAYSLSSPLRWATDTEIPNQMEVSYPSFVVRRGCGELSIACSPSGSVQVIPSEKVYAPAPSWDDSVTVRISDVP